MVCSIAKWIAMGSSVGPVVDRNAFLREPSGESPSPSRPTRSSYISSNTEEREAGEEPKFPQPPHSDGPLSQQARSLVSLSSEKWDSMGIRYNAYDIFSIPRAIQQNNVLPLRVLVAQSPNIIPHIIGTQVTPEFGPSGTHRASVRVIRMKGDHCETISPK